MAEFTNEELRSLLAQDSGPFVSLLMPVVHTGSDHNQNKTRLKNLLRKADDMLNAMHVSRTQIDDMLAPGWASIENDAIFRDEGLAMFLGNNPDSFRFYWVAIPLEEQVIVANSFHIKPLMPLLINSKPFYLLLLSKRQARLLQGSRNGLREIDVPGLPENMDDALQLEAEGRNEGLKSVGASGRPDSPGTQTGIGGQAGSFAGHGAGEEDEKEYYRQYFNLVDHAVADFLKGKTDPLILVAGEYLHPLYKQVNSYPHLIEQGIIGNPTGFTARDLLRRAHPIVEPIFKEGQRVSAERYKEFLHKKQAANRPIEVLQAAYMGQIDSLFVPVGVEMWGTYDFDTNQLEVHSAQKPGDVDLLNLAAMQTVLNGGTVYAVRQEEMPDNTTIAAVYRYALSA
jgi:hypothetical protein